MRTRGRTIPIVAGVVALALVALLGYGLTTTGDDTTLDEAVQNGERPMAPSVALPVLQGTGRRSPADLRGQVVVLNFWASWCDPCVEELPLLERTQKALAPKRGTVVGVNLRDVSSDALTFVRRFKLTFPSLRDPGADYARAYGTANYPETFVLDRRGRIAARKRGPVDQAWLDRTLPPLLAEPEPA